MAALIERAHVPDEASVKTLDDWATYVRGNAIVSTFPAARSTASADTVPPFPRRHCTRSVRPSSLPFHSSARRTVASHAHAHRHRSAGTRKSRRCVRPVPFDPAPLRRPYPRAARPGVVAPDFKVHRTSNLRVVDASIIPLTFGVAPLATVYAIAEKARPPPASRAARTGAHVPCISLFLTFRRRTRSRRTPCEPRSCVSLCIIDAPIELSRKHKYSCWSAHAHVFETAYRKARREDKKKKKEKREIISSGKEKRDHKSAQSNGIVCEVSSLFERMGSGSPLFACLTKKPPGSRAEAGLPGPATRASVAAVSGSASPSPVAPAPYASSP